MALIITMSHSPYLHMFQLQITRTMTTSISIRTNINTNMYLSLRTPCPMLQKMQLCLLDKIPAVTLSMRTTIIHIAMAMIHRKQQIL